MKKLQTIVILITCALLAVSSIAEEKPGKVKKAPVTKDPMSLIHPTVRLDVKLIPLEDGDQGLYITTAAHSYDTGILYEDDGMLVNFEISGKVVIMKDGRIFVVYDACTEFGSEDSNGEFRSKGSAILKPGKETPVAHVGEKTLVITASYPEDTDKKSK